MTWTYDDGNGNTSTQTQNIIVDDITAPVPDLTSLPGATGQCSATIGAAPTATDNCAGTITGTTGDPLTYTTQGTFSVTWTYDDGNGNTTTQEQTVIVDDTIPPVVTITSPANGAIFSTTDQIDVVFTVSDVCDPSPSVTVTPGDPIDPPLDLGPLVITVTATDGSNNQSSASVTVSVTGEVTNQPPNCADAAPSIEEIWPPNHKMVDIQILVEDPDGDPVTIIVTKITQDEPLDTFGDGSFEPDGGGIGTSTAQVRAERSGTKKVPGNGRVYAISFIADDNKGGTCEGTVSVCVPHDQRPGHECIDDGQDYDSVPEGGGLTSGGKKKGGKAKARLAKGSGIGDGSIDLFNGSPEVRFALDSNEPLSFRLDQNFPNPFNPETTIRYSVPEASELRLTIYNIHGQEVRVLINAPHSSARYNTRWDGRDESGRFVSTGVYLYRLEAGTNVELRKMVFVK